MKRLMLFAVLALSGAACVVSPSAKGRPCNNNACDTGFTCVANECVVQGPTGATGATGPVGPQGPAGLGFRASFDFEEGAGAMTKDSSGSNLTGTLTGAGARWSSSGHGVGSALSFDGTTGAVIVEDAPALNPGEQITVSAWVRPNDMVTGDHVIASKEGQFVLLQRDYQVVFSLFTVANETVSGGTLTASAWNEIRGVYDGRSLQLYVNGQLVGSSLVVAGRIALGSKPLTIGGLSNGSASYSGLIDEVRVLGYAQAPLRRTPQAVYTEDTAMGCSSVARTVHLTQNLGIPVDGGMISVNARMVSKANGSRSLFLEVDGVRVQEHVGVTYSDEFFVHTFSWSGPLSAGPHLISITSGSAIPSGCGGKLGSINTLVFPL